MAIDACIKEPSQLVMNDAGELFINEMSSGRGRIRKVGGTIVDGTIKTAAGGGDKTGDVWSSYW